MPTVDSAPLSVLAALLAAVGEAPAAAPDHWSNRLLAIGLALVILLIGYLLSRRAESVFRRVLARRQVDMTVAAFLANLSYWIVIIVVIIIALQKVGIDTTPVTAVLGASTLAIGLALRDSLANFAAGVLIIVLRYYRVGDYIEAGGVGGIVENIGMFDTQMKTPDNRRVIVPNGKITGQPILNFNVNLTRRLDLVFGISYGSDLALAKRILEEVLSVDARVLREPPPVVAVGELADNSVNLFVRPWVKVEDYWNLRFDLLELVKRRFDAAGIVIPFPQRDVRVIHESPPAPTGAPAK